MLALLAAAAVAAGPPAVVWLEGEAATATAPLAAGSGGRADRLATGRWLAADVPAADVGRLVPTGGLTATWPVTTPAGRFDLWLRLADAGGHPPLRWRVAGRPWVDVPGDAPPLDLVPLDDATAVGWVHAGRIDLRAGDHTLELNVPRPAAGPLRVALDALCLSPGPFHPDGPHRPGPAVRSALDWEAAAKGFEFPPAPGTPGDARRAIELAGTWQAARWDEPDPADRTAPVTSLPPDLDARPWRGVRVPGEVTATRPDWALCHRYLLRTRFSLPPDAAGRSVTLRLPNCSLLTSVFVNGTPVGTGDVPHAPLACDLGGAVRPGVNELVLAVKDRYYAVAGTPWAELRTLPPDRFADSDLTRDLLWPVRHAHSGALEPPTLTLAGPVVVADQFARPQVAAGRLALDVTVRNPSATARTAEVRPVVRPVEADGRAVGGTPAKAFAPKPVTVPAGGETVVTFDEPWANPVLWWPDRPQRYVAETTVRLDGRPADVDAIGFGFREWGTAGGRVTLNGVPWKLTADGRHAAPQPGPLAFQAVRDWQANGVSLFRFAGDRPWTGATQADTLTFFDAAGVPVLRAGPPDDGPASPTLVRNRRAMLLARVRAERNSPAVAAWELPAGVDPADVRAIDPTRPAVPADVVRRAVGRPADPAPLAGGAAILTPQQTAAATDRLARRLAEADRWRGAAVTVLDVPAGPGVATAWRPVAVLVREGPAAGPGQFARTIGVFNDTRVGTPITVHWLVRPRGRPGEVRGKRVVQPPPGGSAEFPLTLPLPAGDGELVLSGEREGKEVFRDVHPLPPGRP